VHFTAFSLRGRFFRTRCMLVETLNPAHSLTIVGVNCREIYKYVRHWVNRVSSQCGFM